MATEPQGVIDMFISKRELQSIRDTLQRLGDQQQAIHNCLKGWHKWTVYQVDEIDSNPFIKCCVCGGRPNQKEGV